MSPLLLRIKRIINNRLIYNIRRLYNTIYYRIGNPEDFIIVNCSFKQWGGYVVPYNIGDDINPVIFHHLSGKKVLNIDEFFHKQMVNVMGIGSIIDWKSNNQSIVWGSGIMEPNVKIAEKSKPLKVLAVRGVFTKKTLEKNNINCPDVFGDPALLLPEVYMPSVGKTGKIGFIPHYADQKDPIAVKLLEENKNIQLIDIKHYKNWKDIIDQISSCRCIISSSLHGLILSDAYKVPNVWVKISDKVAGDNFKYLDYFSVVGRDNKCIDLREENILNNLESLVNNYKPISYDPEPLKRSFPVLF